MYSCIYFLFIYLFIYSFIHLFIYLFICLFVCLFIYLFIYSFIQNITFSLLIFSRNKRINHWKSQARLDGPMRYVSQSAMACSSCKQYFPQVPPGWFGFLHRHMLPSLEPLMSTQMYAVNSIMILITPLLCWASNAHKFTYPLVLSALHVRYSLVKRSHIYISILVLSATHAQHPLSGRKHRNSVFSGT
jgi:hypothetical protein